MNALGMFLTLRLHSYPCCSLYPVDGGRQRRWIGSICADGTVLSIVACCKDVPPGKEISPA